MPVKPILTIDIDDKAFQNFQKSWNQYRQALAAMPATWRQVNQQIQGTWASHRGLVSSMVAAGVQQRFNNQTQSEANRILERLDRHTKGISGAWRDVSGSAKSFAHYIGDATKSLLRWTSIGGVVSGLLGLGGLWGLERLGATVAAGRRSALGLGLSYGEQKAFELNFGQAVDPGAVLGGVFEALHDVTKRYTLYTAGLGERDIQGRDTSQVATALLGRLQVLAKATPEAQLGNVFAARGLGQFLTLQDFQRLRTLSPAELQTYQRGFGADVRTLGLSPQTQQAWTHFTIQIMRAGQQIETTLVRGLTPLADPLSKLSDATVHVLDSFLQAAKARGWIEQISKGLERFAKYIGSDEFQKNVVAFAGDVEVLASKVGTFLSWIAGTDPDLAAQRKAAQDRAMRLYKDRQEGKATIGSQFLDLFRTPLDAQGILPLVRKLEGSGDKAVSPAGAVGRYQIEPGTAVQYGFDPSRLKDPTYNENVAKTILADLLRRYHNNIAETLVAYNAGPGVANRFRAGGDNPAMLPRETQRYLEHARALGVKITIQNAPGNNAVVSTSQVAVAP